MLRLLWPLFTDFWGKSRRKEAVVLWRVLSFCVGLMILLLDLCSEIRTFLLNSWLQALVSDVNSKSDDKLAIRQCSLSRDQCLQVPIDQTDQKSKCRSFIAQSTDLGRRFFYFPKCFTNFPSSLEGSEFSRPCSTLVNPSRGFFLFSPSCVAFYFVFSLFSPGAPWKSKTATQSIAVGPWIMHTNLANRKRTVFLRGL